jgi:hypothetical protein
MTRKIVMALAFICISFASIAQNNSWGGVKTNLLYDATATANLGVEIGLAERWSVDISGNYNAWNPIEGSRWKHWLVQPELRFWTCDRFAGHFIAAHAIGGQYNFGGIRNNITIGKADFSQLTDFRFQGWAAGAGLAYGYAWVLSRHLNLEAEIGAGYIYTHTTSSNVSAAEKRSGQESLSTTSALRRPPSISYTFSNLSA